MRTLKMKNTEVFAVPQMRHWGSKLNSSPFKMAAEPAREWNDEQLKSDDLPKKDIIKFIQDNAAHSVCSPLFPVRDLGVNMSRFKFETSVRSASCSVVSCSRATSGRLQWFSIPQS